MPTDNRLYIQVVTKNGREVRAVDVNGPGLRSRALRAANRLAGRRASTGLRGSILTQILEADQPPLQSELAWLYEQLLRPIEGDLSGRKYVHVIPVGELTYLPFAALISQTKPTVQYAVERYTFGYLTSLYMFDLMLKAAPSSSTATFVLGDPDGSLPGARAEAKVVAATAKDSVLRLGNDATYDALVAEAPRTEVLHFATHGILDHSRPERSALLLANNIRLAVPDAMTLKLSNTDLVVLSACETGIGRSGLEYATLARAFMNAGASTVVATLWKVEDGASKEMMQRFYRRVSDGEDRATALAAAQRDLLTSPNVQLHDPTNWAGYIAFGKP